MVLTGRAEYRLPRGSQTPEGTAFATKKLRADRVCADPADLHTTSKTYTHFLIVETELDYGSLLVP